MNIENFFSAHQLPYLATPGIGLCPITDELWEEGQSLSVGFHLLILITKGSLTMSIHGKGYTISEQQIGEVVEQDEALVTDVSAGTEGWLLFFKEEFFLDVFNHQPPMDFAYIDRMSTEKVMDIDERTEHSLDLLLSTFYDTMTLPDHHYLNTLLRLKLKILYFEINEFHHRFTHRPDYHRPDCDRQKDIFSQFIRLVNEYSHTERSVAFYARKLCISQQYLSRVVKSVTQKTPAAHIEQCVVSQIKTMLADQFTVKQIAAEMNFPDHASLSKYFKRVTGNSPKNSL